MIPLTMIRPIPAATKPDSSSEKIRAAKDTSTKTLSARATSTTVRVGMIWRGEKPITISERRCWSADGAAGVVMARLLTMVDAVGGVPTMLPLHGGLHRTHVPLDQTKPICSVRG